MPHKESSPLKLGGWLGGCLLFAGACRQWPLFTSNQNTYFLPGLARAGYGHLRSDWLAGQTDIVPVFSALVSLVHRSGFHGLFYLGYAVLAAVYAASLCAIAAFAWQAAPRTRHVVLFLAAFTGLQCAWVLTPVSSRIPALSGGISLFQQLAQLCTEGVAGQILLGPMFQPSAFGVLLLASLALFLRGKAHLAVLSAVAAATIHTSLILHAGVLIAGYVLVLFLQREPWKAVRIGLLALALILPTVLYIGDRFFLSDTGAIHAAGQVISAEVRQPHHALVSHWFAPRTCVQLAIVVAGMALSFRCRPLFRVLLVCVGAAVALTILQVVTGNLGLALLFPWRSSTWFIPTCTALVLFHAAGWLDRALDRITSPRINVFARRWVVPMAAGVLTLLSLTGIALTLSDALKDPDRGTVVEHARNIAGPAQVYLVPVDFERFRLAAGVPVFVDWKSFPYRSSEIIAWYERIQLANAFYGARNTAEAAEALAAIRRLTPITHLIVEAGKKDLLADVGAVPLFQDHTHVLVRLGSAGPAASPGDHDGAPRADAPHAQPGG